MIDSEKNKMCVCKMCHRIFKGGRDFCDKECKQWWNRGRLPLKSGFIKGVAYYKMRFEILQRDKFTCQYCGRKSPFVELEVDHIIPRAKGGTNTLNNLITSCWDCNMGKGDRELSSFPYCLLEGKVGRPKKL